MPQGRAKAEWETSKFKQNHALEQLVLVVPLEFRREVPSSILQEGYYPFHVTSADMSADTWWHVADSTRPMTRSRHHHDPPGDWRSTTVDRWSGGGRRWSDTVDRLWPPLTTAVDR
ncbi:hypothetical protein Tco_1498543 [Tanacetum coccineum]